MASTLQMSTLSNARVARAQRLAGPQCRRVATSQFPASPAGKKFLNKAAHSQSMFAKSAKQSGAMRVVCQAVDASAPAVAAPASPAPAPSPPMLPPFQLVARLAALSQMKAQYSTAKIFVLSMMAGAYIGVGGLLMTLAAGGSPALAAANPGLHKFLLGVIGLPFGLFMSTVTASELFTGNVMVFAVGLLDGKVTNGDVSRNWAVSWVGNLVGSLLLALAVSYAGSIAVPSSIATAKAIAANKVGAPFFKMLVKGTLCNWLVTLAVALAISVDSAPAKFLTILLPISLFVTAGWEHSVANMYLIPQGILHGAGVSWGDFFLRNLLPVTLGNILGGALLTAFVMHFAFGNKPKQ